MLATNAIGTHIMEFRDRHSAVIVNSRRTGRLTVSRVGVTTGCWTNSKLVTRLRCGERTQESQATVIYLIILKYIYIAGE